MIYKATKIIEQALLAEDFKCDVVEREDCSGVVTTFSLKSGNAVTIHFISTSDDNDVSIRVFGFVKNIEDRHTAMLETCNQLNCDYRYAKFTLEDGQINVLMDIPQYTEDLSSIAVELLIRIVNIMDDAYPILMKALWG